MSGITPEALAEYRRGWRRREEARRARREERRLAALAAARQAILTLAGNWPSVRRVYLFGSITEPGMFHERSDIDVAVAGTTAEDYFAFGRALDEALPQFLVDVREINAPSFFADQVRATGVLLYEREDSTA